MDTKAKDATRDNFPIPRPNNGRHTGRTTPAGTGADGDDRRPMRDESSLSFAREIVLFTFEQPCTVPDNLGQYLNVMCVAVEWSSPLVLNTPEL